MLCASCARTPCVLVQDCCTHAYNLLWTKIYRRSSAVSAVAALCCFCFLVLSSLIHSRTHMLLCSNVLFLRFRHEKRQVRGSALRDEFSCPITRELMRDPVIAADGHTYDREAIEMWFRNHDTSPKVGNGTALPFRLPVPSCTCRVFAASSIYIRAMLILNAC